MKQELRYCIADEAQETAVQELLQKALFSLKEVVILDAKGRMVYFSEDYAKTMGINPEDAIGRHITEVIPDSVLPSVLKSGRQISGAIYSRNGNTMLVNRTPIIENGEVLGVVAESIITGDTGSGEMELKLGHLTKELNYYKEKYERLTEPVSDLRMIVGDSDVMRDLKEMVRSVAPTKSTVLLTGESGTGKEVFAAAIHALSDRKDKPFIKLNCAAIPDMLLESELFGYVEGAFTGAVKGGKIGDFEAADGGTIFLDEVDSLSPNMQAKLLRVLQEREIKKIGGVRTIPVDVRLIFATNKDLHKRMQEELFREDFYYRINVINLRLPALRERREDIPPLVNAFVKKYNDEMGRDIQGVEEEAMDFFAQYDWPGNIRELENCIERSFIYCRGEEISLNDVRLPGILEDENKVLATDGILPLKKVRERAEKAAIRKTLLHCNGNKSEAAKLLEVDRSILYDKIKRYGI